MHNTLPGRAGLGEAWVARRANSFFEGNSSWGPALAGQDPLAPHPSGSVPTSLSSAPKLERPGSLLRFGIPLSPPPVSRLLGSHPCSFRVWAPN